MKTITRTAKRTVTTTCEFNIYKDVVHAIHSEKTSGRKPVVKHSIIPMKEYEANKHKKTFSWVLPYYYQIFTPEFIEFYEAGKAHLFSYDDAIMPEASWAEILGQSERCDCPYDDYTIGEYRIGTDGFLYGLNGKKLWRGITFDSHDHFLREDQFNCDLDWVEEHLDSRPDVKEVEIERGDVYDYDGWAGSCRVITFCYIPTIKMFNRWFNTEKKNPHDWGLKRDIMKRLGLNKFLKEKIK